ITPPSGPIRPRMRGSIRPTAERGDSTAGAWPARCGVRNVLAFGLAPAGGLEALDPAVEDRPDEDEDLTDQVRHLLLQLRRHELAQRGEHRDELLELVAQAKSEEQ